ncbi:MAG: methionine biosynthesis protein MetW [Elusimicrobia bacterium]|nr:methionine biosynthesis protein MetW [Elusimicrobiota bacterium]
MNPENDIILKWVEKSSSVLDLGCGDGELLALLVKEKNVSAQGIEIDEQAIYKCVANGISVYHEDLDNGLKNYAENSFDYVILNESIQQVKNPGLVLQKALRIGKKVIVGFPNFTYYKSRIQLFFKGVVPVTPSLPFEWFNTPNSHFLSIKDFEVYCQKNNIKVLDSAFTDGDRAVKLFPNLFAQTGLFLSQSSGILRA